MDDSTFSAAGHPDQPAFGRPQPWWRRFARCAAALVLAVILVSLVLATAAAQGPLADLVRITIASDGATRDSTYPDIDAAGTRIVFYGDSDLLGQGILDAQDEIWLYDSQTMTYTRVTTASAATRDSRYPAISGTGVRIAFESDSDLIGQGIPDDQFEIWLYDTQTMAYTRITTASPAGRDSGNVDISADGTRLVFDSNADFLGQGILAVQGEVWLYDTGTGTLTRVTTSSDPAARDSRYPVISPDGSWVVFESDSDFLGQGIADDQFEVWLYSVAGGTLTRITAASDGATRDSFRPAIDADGSRIVFYGDSDLLGQGIPDNQYEVWLYDTQTMTHTRITPASATNRDSGDPAISADGTQIVLVSDSDLSGEGIANDQDEVWLYDLQTLEYTRLTTLSDPLTRNNNYPAINDNGTRVVFYSDSDFLGQGIANDQEEIWLATRAPELVLSKTIAADPEVAGTGTVYTITITHQGTVTAANVTLSDTLHISTTLTTVDQTDDDNSALGFGGGTHDNTQWVDGRPAIDGDEWLQMADPGLGNGQFTSRVIDAGYAGAWDELAWRPERPYGQPLPDNGSAETSYPLGNADMVGSRVLLHLGEAGPPFADTSGHGHDGECAECPTGGVGGRFGDALSFDGVDNELIVPDPADPVRYAVELWVYPTTVTDTSLILRTDTLSGTAANYSHLLGISDGQFVHCTRAPNLVCAAGTTDVQPNTWYHVVGTAESNGDIKLFVNGQEESRVDEIGAVWAEGDEYRLGAAYGAPGTTAPFGGRIDEVAIYSRTLSSGEVHDHYLRGALRLVFEARSCANADCSDGMWDGPYTDPGPWPSALLSLPANRYFQYRVTLESDDPAASPRLAWAHIAPDHWVVQATRGSCDPQAAQFTCALGTLAPGDMVTITLPAHIDPSMLGVITNTAIVTTSTPGDLAFDSTGMATATVISEVRLQVFKYDDERDLPEEAPVDPDSHDPVNPGAPLTYTLAVHNGGPSTAWAVTLTDTMPVDIDGVDVPSGWSCQTDGPALTCTVPSLAASAWHYFTLYGTAPMAEGVITNTAAITAAGSMVYPDLDRTAVETTTVTPLADLSVVKAAVPDPIDPGTDFTYVITVTNNGPSPASSLVITDDLPAGTTGSGTGCTSGSTVVCTAASVDAGDSVVFVIDVTNPIDTGVLVNRAVVSADTHDPDEQNNQIVLYTAIRRVADLEIAKTVDPDPVSAGGTLTYTLTVTNTGPAAAGEMTTLVQLESGRAIAIPIGGRGRPYPSTMALSGVDGLTRDVTVTVAGLEHTYPADLVLLLVGPGGRSVVLMANAGGGVDASGVDVTWNDAGEALPMSGALSSAAVYRPTNYGLGDDLPADAPAGPYGGSLSAFFGASPNGVWQLYVYDTFDSDGGQIAGWSLDIATVTTDTLTVTDTLPLGVSGVAAAAPAGWQCSTGGGTVTCQGEHLEVDGQAILTLSATAPITGGTIANTAHVTATVADDDLADNTATVTHTVLANADLSIAKSASANAVAPGALFQYTLAVSNTGPSPLASTITVTDQLPDGLSGISAAGTGWTCSTAALPLLTCTRSGLALGAGPGILVSARAPAATGPIANTAWITSAAGDPQPENNIASATVQVTTTAAGNAIYLPLVLRNWPYAPDLVVESVQVSANAIQVIVRNTGGQGIARAFENEFWVDVYINPSRAPASVNEIWQLLGSQGIVWGVTQAALPLDMGQALTLTVTPAGGAYYDPTLSHVTWPLPAGTVVYVQVDSAHEQTTYGAIRENHEIVGRPYNNIAGPILAP